MSLKGWYPLALSRDIAPGSSAGTRLLGREFVIWRDNAGAAHVWEDRCPHRGMKLSFGFVRGDHIACLYHGWQYDAEGQCRYIPAHPNLHVPKAIKVPRFAVTEVDGIIWSCFDVEDASRPPPEQLDATTPLRTIFADCSESLMVGRIAMTPYGADTPDVTGKTDRIVEIRLGDTSLFAGIQPLAGNETALHLVVKGAVDIARLKPMASWTEQLRRDVEAAALLAVKAEASA